MTTNYQIIKFVDNTIPADLYNNYYQRTQVPVFNNRLQIIISQISDAPTIVLIDANSGDWILEQTTTLGVRDIYTYSWTYVS